MIGMFDFETNKTTKNDFQMNRSMIEGRQRIPSFQQDIHQPLVI